MIKGPPPKFHGTRDNLVTNPDLDYRKVSPRLQLVRGPYPIVVGIAAYEKHLDLHHSRPAPPAWERLADAD